MENSVNKRSIGILGALALAAAPAVRAEEPLTYKLYGKLDGFVEYDWNGSSGNRLSFESGGLVGSRLGVKGDFGIPDAPSAVKGIYQLESGFFFNNGRQAQGGRIFGRQGYAGVTSPWGTLTAGRQYTPLNNMQADYDAFGLGIGSPFNQGPVNNGADSRYDGSILYATPTVGGFTGNLMTALGGKIGHTSRNQYAASLNWGTGPFSVGAVWQRDDHYLLSAATQDNFLAAASVRVGPAKLMGGAQEVRVKPDAAKRIDRFEWAASASVDVTKSGQLWLSYGTGKTKDAPVSDRSQMMSAAWVETINQRFSVYVVASAVNNDEGAALFTAGTSSYGGYGYDSSAPLKNGDDPRTVATGFILQF